MGEQKIIITQSFNAPVETIFDILTDHEKFGRIIKAKTKRVVDSRGKNKNGVGSVRRINVFAGLSFEESVVAFEPNQLMAYRISKGSPVKNHRGCMEFTEEQGRTRVDYRIDFEPKLPFFFLGAIIKKAIETPMRKGMKKLADQYCS